MFAYFFFHQKNPEKYNLVEVLLDKGVAERMLDREERPWELIQQARKVSYFFIYICIIIFLLENCYFLL